MVFRPPRMVLNPAFTGRLHLSHDLRTHCTQDSKPEDDHRIVFFERFVFRRMIVHETPHDSFREYLEASQTQLRLPWECECLEVGGAP